MHKKVCFARWENTADIDVKPEGDEPINIYPIKSILDPNFFNHY